MTDAATVQGRTMTGAELRDARGVLGRRIGLGRPLHCSEMGAALGLKGRDVGATVIGWEKGDGPTGPAAAAVRAWLRETEGGCVPPEIAAATGQGQPTQAHSSVREREKLAAPIDPEAA